MCICVCVCVCGDDFNKVLSLHYEENKVCICKHNRQRSTVGQTAINIVVMRHIIL